MTDKKKEQLIKNMPFSQAIHLAELVEYKEGQVVSRTLAAKPHVNITLFAFEQGEEISAHNLPRRCHGPGTGRHSNPYH